MQSLNQSLRSLLWATASLAVVALAGAANADSVTGYVGFAKSSGDLGFSFNYPDGTTPVVFGGHLPSDKLTPDKKRDFLVGLLTAHGFTASAVGDTGYKVDGLPAGTKVKFLPIDTGEAEDQLKASKPSKGEVGFSGSFLPHDLFNQPTIFTAGIVTDVGVLSAQVSAAELNFDTSGPVICQALFQRLLPRAPQYGVQINVTTDTPDRLDVYFNPAYTAQQGGGVIWGTTADQHTGGDGPYGSITTMVPLPPAVWTGLTCLGALAGGTWLRRRGQQASRV